MHLHCHLKECICNYDPVYNFWLYSYERYNGILEHFPSSNRLLDHEIQMMQRFFNEFKLSTVVEDLPKECYPELQEIFKSNLDPCLKESLHATTNDLQLFLTQRNLPSISDWKLSLLVNYLLFPPSYICSSFDSSLKLQLKDTYNLLYPSNMLGDINVNATFKKYRSIEYNGINYNAKKRLIVYATHLTDLRSISSN